MNTYLDTSLLVSLYVPERYTLELTQYLLSHKEDIYISRLVETEFLSALAMKKRLKEITPKQTKDIIYAFKSHCNNLAYQSMHITDDIFDTANSYLIASKSNLRTLDAIHLACTSILGAKLLTADKDFAKSAKTLKVPYHLI